MKKGKDPIHNVGDTVVAVDLDNGDMTVGYIIRIEKNKIFPYVVNWTDKEVENLEQNYDETTISVYKENAKELLEE